MRVHTVRYVPHLYLTPPFRLTEQALHSLSLSESSIAQLFFLSSELFFSAFAPFFVPFVLALLPFSLPFSFLVVSFVPPFSLPAFLFGFHPGGTPKSDWMDLSGRIH